MIAELLSSLRRARAGQPADVPGSREALEVCPPALGRLAARQPLGLRGWLNARWRDSTSLTTATPHRTQRRPEQGSLPLTAVRADFTAALAGEPGPAASALLGRILLARSMRELWHLRTDVYTLVARAHGEAEARQRLQRLNGHFATRSGRPRSPSAPL